MSERSAEDLASLELELRQIERFIAQLDEFPAKFRERGRYAWLVERAATLRGELACG